MTQSIINKWSVLKNLSEDFVSNISSVYIFGKNGKQVIIITNDVCSFGDNDSNGCLGLGHTNEVQEPTKIVELCGQQVIQIEFSADFKFVMAFTHNGNIYSWGCNVNGELGIGNFTAQSKPNIIDILSDKNVIDIKITSLNTLALTSCGDVYIWAFPMVYTPTKMTYESMKHKIMAISTGLSLTNTGIVFYWGNNEYGQCGSGNKDISNVANWRKSEQIDAYYAEKIACGPNHSMILSKMGNIYCFGNNNGGQCGDGTNVNKNNPTKVNINAKFIDICATKHNHMSVGLSDNGSCYIWGECGLNTVVYPIEIPCNDINVVLQRCLLRNFVTLIPLRFGDKSASIMDRIGNKFNKLEFSDIAFKVDGKLIYAQKAHLINVCNYFEERFSDKKWSESNKSEIEIKNYSYDVYYAFIKYLYTNRVDICGVQTIELMGLANCQLDETLKQKCFEIIKKSIKDENVFVLFNAADKYKLEELKAYFVSLV